MGQRFKYKKNESNRRKYEWIFYNIRGCFSRMKNILKAFKKTVIKASVGRKVRSKHLGAEIMQWKTNSK